MANNRKFERSCSNRVIAGVCAGLGDYFNIDVALMRVLFVVSAICGGFGFWLYIILWVVVPEEPLVGPRFSGSDETIDITPDEDKPKDDKRSYNGAMIASMVLIFIGLIALLDNFASVNWVWKLWPAVLIIIGVMIIINTQKNRYNE